VPSLDGSLIRHGANGAVCGVRGGNGLIAGDVRGMRTSDGMRPQVCISRTAFARLHAAGVACRVAEVGTPALVSGRVYRFPPCLLALWLVWQVGATVCRW
jgi:hypothetical protein